MWYMFLGMMYFCIGTCAVCGNFIVLKIFGSFPALRTPANMLVMNLAFSDFALMLSLFPEMVYNFFCGGSWQFGETACQIHAFLGSVFGYSQIFTLTVVSWDRYNVIVKGFSGAPLTFSKVSAILFVNYVWSFLWSDSELTVLMESSEPALTITSHKRRPTSIPSCCCASLTTWSRWPSSFGLTPESSGLSSNTKMNFVNRPRK